MSSNQGQEDNDAGTQHVEFGDGAAETVMTSKHSNGWDNDEQHNAQQEDYSQQNSAGEEMHEMDEEASLQHVPALTNAETQMHEQHSSSHHKVPPIPHQNHSTDSFDINRHIDVDDDSLVDAAIQFEDTLDPSSSGVLSSHTFQIPLGDSTQEIQRVSPFYLRNEAKRMFYMEILPKQRSVMIILTYALCVLHILTLAGVVVFAHPLTILMAFAQLISLLYNMVCLVLYHLKDSDYLAKNLSYPAAQCMFNVFVGGLAIFANGIITTLVLASLMDTVNESFSCFFFCLFPVPGLPFWLWCILAFLNNIFIYLSAIFSFGQGYAAGMFLVYKESLDLLPNVDKFGVPSVHEHKIQHMRTQVIRLQRLAFGTNIGLILTQILFGGFMAGLFLILLVWGVHPVLLWFYALTTVASFAFTIMGSALGVILKYFYFRKLCVLANALQFLASLSSIGYALVLLLCIETEKNTFSTITFLIIGSFGVVNVAKALLTVSNFVLGVALTMIRIRMSHVAKISYFSTPTWRKGPKSVEEVMFSGFDGVRRAPEYDDLMSEEWTRRRGGDASEESLLGGRGRGGDDDHEDADLLHEDIELTVTDGHEEEMQQAGSSPSGDNL